jgi:hypothetical protein
LDSDSSSCSRHGVSVLPKPGHDRGSSSVDSGITVRCAASIDSGAGYGAQGFVAIVRPAVELTALAFAFTRFGLLSGVAVVFTGTTLRSFPLTTNPSTCFAPWALFGLATVLAVALYGFTTTLRGRPMGSAPATP